MEIREIQIDQHISNLTELLTRVVNDGAALGFMPPLSREEAVAYWSGMQKQHIVTWAAFAGEKLVGSVQLHPSTKTNALHRAEIAKLMTDPDNRRQGIAKRLLTEAEKRAKQEGRSLLILDTREGDPSNFLYKRMGYMEGGRIPYYAKSANGELHGTVIYYKTM